MKIPDERAALYQSRTALLLSELNRLAQMVGEWEQEESAHGLTSCTVDRLGAVYLDEVPELAPAGFTYIACAAFGSALFGSDVCPPPTDDESEEKGDHAHEAFMVARVNLIASMNQSPFAHLFDALAVVAHRENVKREAASAAQEPGKLPPRRAGGAIPRPARA